MDIVNYSVISGISLLILLGCLMHLYENDIFSTAKIRKFLRLIVIMMIEIVVDLVFVLLEGKDVATIWLYIIKSIELGINPFLAFLVFDIFYDNRDAERDSVMRIIRTIMILLLVGNVILQLVGLFGWHVFTIDENNYYKRGPLVYVYVAILFLTIIIQAGGVELFSSRTQSTMAITLAAFVTILFAGIILRNYFANYNYDFLCMSISVPFLLIYYSNVILRVDALTKLLNRQVYEKKVRRINYTTVFIMIDANNFKSINDDYGHECGDQTLKQIATAIYETYGKYAYCFRIGGDEFCAILKSGAFERLVADTPRRDVYSMTEKLMERLDEALLAMAGEQDSSGCLNYGVSQGYGIYYSEFDYPSVKEKMSLEDVIKLADERMYYEKELFKKNQPTINVVPVAKRKRRVKVLYKHPAPELVKNDAENDA